MSKLGKPREKLSNFSTVYEMNKGLWNLKKGEDPQGSSIAMKGPVETTAIPREEEDTLDRKVSVLISWCDYSL